MLYTIYYSYTLPPFGSVLGNIPSLTAATFPQTHHLVTTLDAPSIDEAFHQLQDPDHARFPSLRSMTVGDCLISSDSTCWEVLLMGWHCHGSLHP